MFTSIEKLRASSAMQSRVSSVEGMLRKDYPGYTPEMVFPVFLIAKSNSLDDVEWVRGTAGTHINVVHVSAALNKAIKEEMSLLRKGKGSGIEELTKHYVNTALSAFAGKAVSLDTPAYLWFKHNAVTVDGAPASAAAVPVAVPAAAKTPAAAETPAQVVEEAASVPATPAVKFVQVTQTMQQRIDKLVTVGTSKDKRSQILEATGQSLETILTILASAGALPAGKLDQLLAAGLK